MCLKSYFKEIVLKLATNGQSDKGFLLTSTFVIKGLFAPVLGLYTCIKVLKYIPGAGVRSAFTGRLVLWLLFMIKHLHSIFVKHITFMHILMRNAANLRLKLVNFTSFQILLIVPELSPLTNITALHAELITVCFVIAVKVACQYNTNSFDKEPSFVFYRQPKRTIFSKIYYCWW